MGKKIDLTGKTFGRLTVLSVLPRAGPQLRWACRCSCGREMATDGSSLRTGHTKSCGCLNQEMRGKASVKHGLAKTRVFRIWTHIKSRCFNPNVPAYPDYGGRGITMCDRWRYSLEAFVADLGLPGPGEMVERIDNNGDYEPGNCKWADRRAQNNNTRRNRHITYDGRTQTASQWAREIGLTPHTILKRLDRGWTAEESLTVKAQKSRHWRD